MGRRKDLQPLKSGQLAGRLPVGFGGGAVGFGDTAASSDDPLASELQQHLKRLSKKSPTTKLKALGDLQSLVHDGTQDAVTRCIIALPQWCRLYVKLANDDTVQVREAAHKLMGRVASVVQSELEPYVPSVLARWWMAQYDPRAEARRAAQSTLAATFPGRRINKALRLCRKRLFAELLEVFKSSPQTVVDAKAVEGIDVAKEMYERQVRCALYGLGGFIERLVEGGKLDDDTQTDVEALLTSVWRLGTSKYPQIRLGYFALVPVLCQHMLPSVERNLPRVAPTVLGAANDGTSHNYAVIWTAMLHVCKAIPGAWNHVEAERVVLPCLWECLRAGAYESWAATYPAMLPLLSLLPRHLVTLQLAENLCESLWYPVATRTVSLGVVPHVATAWAECAAHLISDGPLAAAACCRNVISAADVDGWLQLPSGPKVQGKPSAEQIAALKEVKAARAEYLRSLIEKLGGEWTVKSVEKELSRQQSNAGADSKHEDMTQADDSPSEADFARACLHKPAMAQLRLAKVDYTASVEAVAVAVATRLSARPRLHPSHIDILFSAAAELAVEQAVIEHCDNSVALCSAWFVAFVRNYVKVCQENSVESVAVARAVQTLADSIISSGDIPEIAHLQLLAHLAAAPLGIDHLVSGDPHRFVRARLLPWLLNPSTGTAQRVHLIDLLFSHLRALQFHSEQAQEQFDTWVRLICDAQAVEVLLELLQTAMREGILDALTPNSRCLDLIGLSDGFRQRVLEEAAAAELLRFGMVSQTLFSTRCAIELMSWLAHTLRAHSAGDKGTIRNLCAAIDGTLHFECHTAADATEGAAFYAARTDLIAQVFVLQVPVTSPALILDCGSLQTSTVCAKSCSELWNDHSGVLLSVDTDHSLDESTSNLTQAAWISLAPVLVTNILDILLYDQLGEPRDMAQDYAEQPCVQLASEALAMSKCVSPQCLQETLALMLSRVVSPLAAFLGECTDEAATGRFSRILGFAVGLVRVMDPVDLFLGEDTDVRRCLLLELCAISDREFSELEHPAMHALADATRSLAQCELRNFWISCCDGTLAQDNKEGCADSYSFVVQSVQTAVALGVDENSYRLHRVMDALFPHTSVVNQGTISTTDCQIVVTEPLKHQLDVVIVTPWLSTMLGNHKIKNLDGAKTMLAVTAILPYLTLDRQWTVATSCANWLLDREHLDTTNEKVGMLVSVAGRSFFLALLNADTSSTTADKLLLQSLLTHLIKSMETAWGGQFHDMQMDHLWALGIGYLMHSALVAGDHSRDQESRWWRCCVTHATKAMAAVDTRVHWRNKIQCLGLELTATLLDKMPQSSIPESEQESFEDLLTGVAYMQLVDTDADRPAVVCNALAAVLPKWRGPQRTILLEYADELAAQLHHQQHEVRVEVYQLLMRLVDTTLEGWGDENGVDQDDEHGEYYRWGDGSSTDRPVLPELLWNIVEVEQPEKPKIFGYLLSWAIVLQTLAHAPQQLKANLVEYIHAGGTAARLLSFLVNVLPLSERQKGDCSAILNLSDLRENGDTTKAAAALFGRALQQVRISCLQISPFPSSLQNCLSFRPWRGNGLTRSAGSNILKLRNTRQGWYETRESMIQNTDLVVETDVTCCTGDTSNSLR